MFLALGAVLLGVVVHKDGVARQIVHRNVEEALDLGGVQVHGQHPVGAGGGEHVGHQLGGDGVTGLGLAVLPGIAVVGDDRGDAAGGGALQRVDHDEQLHEIVVHRGAGGLDHEHVAAADRLVQGRRRSPPSEKVPTSASPSLVPINLQISSASFGFALPENTLMSLP